MSTSTDGQLSFGLIFDEGFEFPWCDEDGDGDEDDFIRAWWYKRNSYGDPTLKLYDSDGNCVEPESSRGEAVARLYSERREWEEAHPIPIQVVNYCSCDSPMLMLATRHFSASRGYPKELDLECLVSLDLEPDRQILSAFLEEYGIESDHEPQWFLSSLWC